MEILMPKLKPSDKQQVVIYYTNAILNPNKSAVLLRISLDDEFTKIDFLYQACNKYTNGGWVQIHDTCFIKPSGSDIKLKMITAINITIAPKKHFFKSKTDMLCYTLIFPPLPKGTEKIDIIEMETNDTSFFNFYGISMDQIRTEKIITSN